MLFGEIQSLTILPTAQTFSDYGTGYKGMEETGTEAALGTLPNLGSGK